MELPPPRYRVVERGRRLEVIDTWKGEAARPGAAAPRSEEGGPGDGSAFVTRRWYDARAPRLIPLNYATRARLANLRMAIAVSAAVLVALLFLLWPFSLVVLVALLASAQVRRGLRGASTGWIDSLDQAASGSSAG